jgi:hypothetical protein
MWVGQQDIRCQLVVQPHELLRERRRQRHRPRLIEVAPDGAPGATPPSSSRAHARRTAAVCPAGTHELRARGPRRRTARPDVAPSPRPARPPRRAAASSASARAAAAGPTTPTPLRSRRPPTGRRRGYALARRCQRSCQFSRVRPEISARRCNRPRPRPRIVTRRGLSRSGSSTLVSPAARTSVSRST